MGFINTKNDKLELYSRRVNNNQVRYIAQRSYMTINMIRLK